MPKYPQVLENVRVASRIDPDKSPRIQEAVAQAEARLGSAGRIVLRPSGTEPVIRVMVEGSDEKLVRELARELAVCVARLRRLQPEERLAHRRRRAVRSFRSLTSASGFPRDKLTYPFAFAGVRR